MIEASDVQGRALAGFFFEVAPRLFTSLEETGLLPEPGDPERARSEWGYFALHACLRGLVAAGGFGARTARTIDAFHDAVFAVRRAEGIEAANEAFELGRARWEERHAEYGEIGTEGGAAGAASFGFRLGAAAARHLSGDEPRPELVEMLAALHEELAEGAAETVRRAT